MSYLPADKSKPRYDWMSDEQYRETYNLPAPRQRIQCRHCSNPDKGYAECRWFWWRPDAETLKRQGFDLPCSMDAEEEWRAADDVKRAEHKAQVRSTWKVIFYGTAIVVFFAFTLWVRR